MTTEHLADSYGAEVVDVTPGSFDDLVADGAEVVRHLAEVPRQRALRIPERAVALVSGLDTYGD